MALRSPLTVQPYDYIADSNGRPLDYGQVYIGVANQDPEFYQIPVYLDAAMTKPIDQPIRTNDGFVDFAGSLSELYASGEIYSVKVLDKQGRKVLYKGDMTRKNLMSDALVDLNQSIVDAQSAAQAAIDDTVNNASIVITNVSTDATAAIDNAVLISNDAASRADSAIQDLFESGGLPARPFEAYAKMTAPDVDPPLVDGDYAVVTNDSDYDKNGVYLKQDGEWVYLAYNYNHVINQIITDLYAALGDNIVQKLPFDSEWAFALQGSNGTMGIKIDGEFVSPNPLPKISPSPLASYADNAVFKIADKDGKTIFATDKFGQPIGSNQASSNLPKCRAIKTTNNLKIYQKGTGQNYIEYNFDRVVKPYVSGELYSNADHWRIVRAFECNSDLSRIRPISTDGAWELALKDETTTDFSGTYHGDDITSAVFFMVDDVVYSQTSTFDVSDFSSLRIVQTGVLYKDNTMQLIADYYRSYDYGKQGFELTQTVTWKKALNINGYMAMLPIVRNWNDGQITDTALRVGAGLDMQLEDVTSDSFAESITKLNVNDSVHIWGASSGISASLTPLSLDPKLINADFKISSAPIYNKFYYAVNGNGQDRQPVTIGEVWNTKFHYNVTTSN